MKDNRGFTLIEMIVVVAILAVCVAISGASLSTVSSSQAKKAADEINGSLSKCRIDAMSLSAGVYLKLYRDDSGNAVLEYVKSGTVVSSDAVGTSRCSVSYTTADNAVRSLGSSDSGALVLSFERDTGALRTLQSDGVSDADSQCTQISVSGGGVAYVIRLVPATGMHTLEAGT